MFEEAYVNRAVLNLMRRDLKSAMSDLDTAIRLNPRDASAWSNRGTINLAVEQYADALSDFNRALQISPGDAALYLGRGRANLFAGAIDDSIADFQTTVRLRSSNPYPVIWLHIARVHKGENDRKELAENARNVKRDAWPSVVLDLYLGTVNEEALRVGLETT